MKKFTPVLLVASFAALLTLWLAFRHPYGMNPDGVAYIDLADAWAEARWIDGINGYWSVLLPLMLAPFRTVGLGITVSYALVGAIISFTCVFLTYLLGRSLGINIFGIYALCIAIALRSAVSAIEVWTPDLLFAAVGLGGTLVGLQIQGNSSRRHWLTFGLLCGALMFAKPVGLYTSLLFLIVVCVLKLGVPLWHWNQQASKRAGAAIGGWLLPFLLLTTALSGKYGHLTTGSSGSYNLELTRPGNIGHPMGSNLYDPPFNDASNSWTDPTFMDHKLPFSLISAEGIQLLAQNLEFNIQRLWDEQRPWIYVLLFTAVTALVLAYHNRQLATPFLVMFAMTLLQTVVYLPVLYEYRYLTLSIYLLVILFLMVLDRLWFETRRVRIPFTVGGAVISAFLLFPGAYTEVRSGNDPTDLVMGVIRWRNRDTLRLQAINAELALDPQQCTSVTYLDPANHSGFYDTLTLALMNGWYMAGTPNPDWNAHETGSEFIDHNIDCLFVWWMDAPPQGLENSLELIAKTDDEILKVYHFIPESDEAP